MGILYDASSKPSAAERPSRRACYSQVRGVLHKALSCEMRLANDNIEFGAPEDWLATF